MTAADPDTGRPGFDLSVAVLGGVTLTFQVLYLREMLSLFWGSERVVGAVLGSWLLLGGLGSTLAGVWVARYPRCRSRTTRVELWSGGLLALSVIGPVTIVLIRALPWLFDLGAGRLLPFSTGTALTLFALGLPGLLTGALFVLATNTLGDDDRAAARVYFWDNAGGIVGGLGFTASLVLGFSSSVACAASGAALLALAAFVNSCPGKSRSIRAASLVVALLSAGVALFPFGETIDRWSLSLAYPGERIEARKETPSGQIVVTSRMGQTNAYGSGRFLGSPRVVLAAEEVVHLSLLSHPGPSRALIVNGVLPGFFEPALQHGFDRIDLLEADATLLDLLEARLGWMNERGNEQRGGSGGEKDGVRLLPAPTPRRDSVAPCRTGVRLLFGDVRMWLRRGGEPYDAIVSAGGAPDTFTQHRLLTAEFFTEARRMLKPGGILAFPVPGARSFQNRPARSMLASILRSLRIAFPHARVASLEAAGFLFVASDRPLPDAGRIRSRWISRGISPRELVGEGIGSVLLGSTDRTLSGVLDGQVDALPDLDFEPFAVGYQAALAQVTADGRASWFSERLMRPGEDRTHPALLACLVLGLAFLLVPSGRSDSGLGIGVISAGLAGLAGLLLEILWLDGLQIVRGHLYREAGALLAVFMAGSCTGTGLFLWASRHFSRRGVGQDPFASQRPLGWGLAGLSTLSALVGWVLGASREAMAFGAIVIPLVTLITGGLVGWVFAGAIRASGGHKTEVSGLVYGADLVGAAIGSYLGAGLIIPLLGLPISGVALSLVLAPTSVRLLSR